MILVTGHEPPEGFDANPSATLARRLDGESVEGHRIGGAILPNDEEAAADAIVETLKDQRPAIVLTTGFLPGNTSVVVERLAFAAGDFLAAAEGAEDPDAPVGYISTMSTDTIVDHLRGRDIPTTLAIATDSPLSDRVLFGALEFVTSEGLPTAVGSLGLPCTPEQAVDLVANGHREEIPPSVAAETQLEALLVALKVTVQERQ